MRVQMRHGVYIHRGEPLDVTGYEFDLVRDYRVGARGSYITVDGRSIPDFPDRNIKVYVENSDCYDIISGEPKVNTTTAKSQVIETPTPVETDDEIISRLRARFLMLEQMTRAVKSGAVRAMIVSGPPGVGKSHGIEQVLGRYDIFTDLGAECKYEVIKGAMSPLGLYTTLYQYRAKDTVVVFDDCDSIFSDETSLNLLKAALDSKARRMLHWNTDSNRLRTEGIPNSFEFDGSAIFVTNIRFDRVRGRLRDHLQALESRCHYVDLTIDTQRERLLRIRQIVSDGMLADRSFDEELVEQMLAWVAAHADRLRELSLRTVSKLADLVVAFPNNWPDMAVNTLTDPRR
jgi:hypothetical protein